MENKTKSIHFRLSDKDFKRLKEIAKEKEITVTDYITEKIRTDYKRITKAKK